MIRLPISDAIHPDIVIVTVHSSSLETMSIIDRYIICLALLLTNLNITIIMLQNDIFTIFGIKCRTFRISANPRGGNSIEPVSRRDLLSREILLSFSGGIIGITVEEIFLSIINIEPFLEITAL